MGTNRPTLTEITIMDAKIYGCSTFYFTHCHFDASFTAFVDIFLRIVVGEHAAIQHEVPWLPTYQ